MIDESTKQAHIAADCRMRSSKRASKGNDSQPLLSREGNLSNSKGRPVKRKPIIRQRKIRRKLFVEPKIQKFSKDTSNGDQMNVMCLFDSGSQRSFVTKLFPVTGVKEHVYISTFNDGDRHEKLRRIPCINSSNAMKTLRVDVKLTCDCENYRTFWELEVVGIRHNEEPGIIANCRIATQKEHLLGNDTNAWRLAQDNSALLTSQNLDSGIKEGLSLLTYCFCRIPFGLCCSPYFAMNSVYDLAAFIKQGQSQHGLFYIPPPNGPIFATHCESTPHKMEIHHVRTPWNGGYWERIVRMVRASLRKARPCLMKKRTKLKPRSMELQTPIH
ncbi:hypothetical protein T4E_2791 [Trichinella pseudospiralis]|uniref:Peptidase aspartic putative domain-containing protein n=1 Tax=Trichinella pseudospiralis TaxID=6337 RepID=A0A0V0XQ35_TRIPS|nr:hypothetical protein T4E_2791 [Trichinella pseudospiralis]